MTSTYLLALGAGFVTAGIVTAVGAVALYRAMIAIPPPPTATIVGLLFGVPTAATAAGLASGALVLRWMGA